MSAKPVAKFSQKAGGRQQQKNLHRVLESDRWTFVGISPKLLSLFRCFDGKPFSDFDFDFESRRLGWKTFLDSSKWNQPNSLQLHLQKVNCRFLPLLAWVCNRAMISSRSRGSSVTRASFQRSLKELQLTDWRGSKSWPQHKVVGKILAAPSMGEYANNLAVWEVEQTNEAIVY